ncbi:MAG: hypothetical protein PHN49_02385 [Candidatus Omnitrophica bacterium]|nr:hypothetical protein [Candidatus Omnitrophota bacterium]MDD5670467.1 hypothetical protein [Candidatus Omnitrophota bacterium]
MELGTQYLPNPIACRHDGRHDQRGAEAVRYAVMKESCVLDKKPGNKIEVGKIGEQGQTQDPRPRTQDSGHETRDTGHGVCATVIASPRRGRGDLCLRLLRPVYAVLAMTKLDPRTQDSGHGEGANG